MDMRIPPLEIKIPLESNPTESRISVRRLAVLVHDGTWLSGRRGRTGGVLMEMRKKVI